MQHKSYPLEQLNSFSGLLLDYLSGKDSLRNLYGNSPELNSFENQIQLKSDFSNLKRETLVKVLQKQYDGHSTSVNFNALLDAKTFTVTTGHQLNLFTGPLYVIYKIVSTINLAKKLKQNFPDYHFVPVYWMATEDHDWDEINHFHCFGKKYTFETDQKGPVGRFTLEKMPEFLATFPEKIEFFEKAYTDNQTLAAAVREYMHALFPGEELICIDADDSDLKREFISVMKEDLIHFKHLDLVNEKNQLLEKEGYKPQIHAREINFFYIEKGFRERIEFKNEKYKVVHSSIEWSKEDLQIEIEQHPEKFSPNVVLRPLYQETILPNLAYLGGGAEVAYWLQLKGIFDAHQIPYPILLPRNFALVLTPQHQQRIQKLAIPVQDLFLDERSLKKKFVEEHSDKVLDFQTEQLLIEPIIQQVLSKIAAVDKTLEASVLAEKHKWLSGLENLEKRMRKAEERNQEIQVQQLLTLKSKLFPEGHWQERHENFLNFYVNYPDFIQDLLAIFDPLNFQLYVLELA